MEFLELNAQLRTTTGKGSARSLRRDAQIPAILYSPDTEPVMLAVSAAELETLRRKSTGGQMMLKLKIHNGDTDTRLAMVKELQSDPVSQQPLHIDFYQVDMDRKIRAMVPVVTTGKSIGVEMGGLLQIIRRELEVLCLPGRIPEFIAIDITDLDIGGSVHVHDVTLGEGIEIPTDVNFTVVTITGAKKEAVEMDEDAEGELVGEEAEAAEAEDS